MPSPNVISAKKRMSKRISNMFSSDKKKPPEAKLELLSPLRIFSKNVSKNPSFDSLQDSIMSLDFYEGDTNGPIKQQQFF